MGLVKAGSRAVVSAGKYGTNAAANSSTISMNVWSHIVVTFDGSSTITYYLNGEADGTGTLASVDTTLSKYSVGNVPWLKDQHFQHQTIH